MSDIKISSKALDAIMDLGEVVKGQFRIALADLESFRPSRTRTSEDDRVAAFERVLAEVTPNEDGTVILSVAALEDAGLPAGSVANQTYWSGIAPGSQLAHANKYTSKLVSKRTPEGFYVMNVVLTPATAAQLAKHQEGLAKAEAKAATLKAAKEAADAAAKLANGASNTEGTADTGTASGDTATDTDVSIDEPSDAPSEDSEPVAEEPVAAPAPRRGKR